MEELKIRLQKAAQAVYLACEEGVADDLSQTLCLAKARIVELEEERSELQDFVIWLTGCGYNFRQHKYFVSQRDKLLSAEALDSVDDAPVPPSSEVVEDE